jgi:DNA-binding response OmpR family regulator
MQTEAGGGLLPPPRVPRLEYRDNRPAADDAPIDRTGIFAYAGVQWIQRHSRIAVFVGNDVVGRIRDAARTRISGIRAATIRMTSSAHVLVVDDEPAIGDLIRNYLTRHGLRVSIAGGGSEMRRIMAQDKVDLVLLDLGLPGEDGLTLTRHIRAQSNVGVIIVTGSGESVDRIVSLELGADDFVSKPFDLRELLARIRSVLRRTGSAVARSPAPAPAGCIRFAGWQLETQSRRLFSADGTEVPLTTGEYELLKVFADNPNKVLSRDRLLQETRNRDAGPFDRAIDMQIARLRRKIEVDADRPVLIKSVRGAGYIFTAGVERD